jgi:hypothetical protein
MLFRLFPGKRQIGKDSATPHPGPPPQGGRVSAQAPPLPPGPKTVIRKLII